MNSPWLSAADLIKRNTGCFWRAICSNPQERHVGTAEGLRLPLEEAAAHRKLLKEIKLGLSQKGKNLPVS